MCVGQMQSLAALFTEVTTLLFNIIEVLAVRGGGVLFSIICFKLETAAGLPLIMGLSQPLPDLSVRTR